VVQWCSDVNPFASWTQKKAALRRPEWGGGTGGSEIDTKHTQLVESFTRTRAPAVTVTRALKPQHPQAVIIRIPAWISHDDNRISRLQSLTIDTLPAELSAAAPFNGPANDLSLFVLRFDMHKGMWIPEEELNQLSFDPLCPIFEVRGRKGVVRVKLSGRKNGNGNQ
jgi:hypothetical protein